MCENLALFNTLYSKETVQIRIPEYDFKKANKFLNNAISEILTSSTSIENLTGKLRIYRDSNVMEEVIFTDLNCNCGEKINYNSESLIGNSVGLIKGIGQIEVGDLYPNFVYVVAKNYKNSLGGSLDYKFDRAKKRALYEAIERISWLIFEQPDNLLNESWINLPDTYRMPLENLICYEEDLYNSRDSMLKKIEEDTLLSWVLAEDISGNKIKALPLQYFLSTSKSKEMYKIPSSTGLAASDDSLKAKFNAIMEVIERDIVTRYWKGEVQAIKLSSDNKRLFNSEVFQRLKNKNYDLDIISILNKYGVFVIIAKVYNEALQAYHYGCSAGTNIFNAIEKAVLEALLMKVYFENNNRKTPNYELAYLKIEKNWDIMVCNEGILNEKLTDFYLLNISPPFLKSNAFVYKAWGRDTLDFPSKYEKSILNKYLDFPFN